MLRRIGIIISCIFMLMQASSASPLVKRDAVAVAHHGPNVAAHKSSSSEEIDDPRTQLFIVTLSEIVILSKYTIDIGRPLFTNVLKELNALPSRSGALQTNMTRMSVFLKDTENLAITENVDDTMKIFEEMVNFAELMSDLENMPEEWEVTKTLQKAFKDSGVDKVEEDFKKHTYALVDRFNKSFDAYLSVVTDEQKKRDHKLLEWYNKWKNTTDKDEKLGMFADFFNDENMQ